MPRPLPIALLIATAWCTACAAGAEPPLAVPVDGEPFAARLSALDRQWNLSLDVDGKPRTLAAAELVCWGDCPETAGRTIVVTADTGLLVAEVFAADKETLTAESLLLGTLKLPLKSLAGVVFDPPAGRPQRDRLLDRVARADGSSDRLLLHNGDELTGLIAGLADDALTLETDLGPIEVKIERIAALVFSPALRQATPSKELRCWVGFRDGSLLLATQLEMGEKALKLTAAGRPWLAPAEELVWLMPLGGRVTYLSDLEPAGYRHLPYLSLSWPYRRDRNVTGGRLRCDGRLYPKGIGVHSAARLTYQLDGSYRRFQAELGIDDSTAGRGSVRGRIYVDGRQQYAGETVRGGMAPVPISVDLTGAKRLDLIIDYADRADELDHADWLGARLVK